MLFITVGRMDIRMSTIVAISKRRQVVYQHGIDWLQRNIITINQSFFFLRGFCASAVKKSSVAAARLSFAWSNWCSQYPLTTFHAVPWNLFAPPKAIASNRLRKNPPSLVRSTSIIALPPSMMKKSLRSWASCVPVRKITQINRFRKISATAMNGRMRSKFQFLVALKLRMLKTAA